MGRERSENGGRTCGANASRRATLLGILACALAGAGAGATAAPAAAQTTSPHRFNLPFAHDLAADAAHLESAIDAGVSKVRAK
jgi:hypothetical protein